MVTRHRHELAWVNNIRIHYVIAGSGPPIYLLHGWPQCWFEWEPFIDFLANRFTVVVPDLRGFGDSEKPPTGYDLATQAVDIGSLALSLSHKRIAIVGHDVGGPVAYAVAATQPELVAGLLLFEAPLYGLQTQGVPQFETDYWHFGFHACRDLPEVLIAGKEQAYLEFFFSEFSYRRDAFSRELIDRFSQTLMRPGGLRASLEHYRSIDVSRRQMKAWLTSKLDIPVGGFGGSHSLADAVQKSVEAISNHPFGGVIPLCGHWVCEERPDFLLSQIDSLATRIGW